MFYNKCRWTFKSPVCCMKLICILSFFNEIYRKLKVRVHSCASNCLGPYQPRAGRRCPRTTHTPDHRRSVYLLSSIHHRRMIQYVIARLSATVRVSSIHRSMTPASTSSSSRLMRTCLWAVRRAPNLSATYRSVRSDRRTVTPWTSWPCPASTWSYEL